MSDYDYHQGYWEGIRNASHALVTMVPLNEYNGFDLDKYKAWLMQELSSANRLRLVLKERARVTRDVE